MIESLKELLKEITEKNFDKKTIVYLAVAIEILEKLIKGEEKLKNEKFKNNTSEEYQSR